MSKGFVHSVKVPRIYKITANIVQCVRENGGSLKTLIYEKKHPNVSGIYALSVNTLQASSQLDLLLRKTCILLNEPRLDPWLARVLITELLWGKKTLSSNAKPVQTVLTYENKLRQELENINSKETQVLHRHIVQRPRYVRINTLLLSIERAITLFLEEGWKLLPAKTTYSSYLESLSQLSEPYFMQDIHIPEVLAFPQTISFHEHAGYKSGELILQDKASCFSAHLLNPTMSTVVLDMCAAPGMKTTHLAAKLQNHGKIYAVEIDNKRFATLCDQVTITHSFCVQPINKDALSLDPKQCPNVEYILVDPSCTGSGKSLLLFTSINPFLIVYINNQRLMHAKYIILRLLFRKNFVIGIIGRPKQDNMDGEYDPKRLQNLQSFQVYLLKYALLKFPTVKRVVYSTCSIHPQENEEVIDEVLMDIGDAYTLLPVKKLLKNNWINYSSKKYNCKNKCLYTKPDIDYCNGFFVAVFERNFDTPLPECKRRGGNIECIQQVALNDQSSNMLKKVSRKRKKRGKKRDKEESAITDIQTTKAAEVSAAVTAAVSEIENEEVDVCTHSICNDEKAVLYESENIKSKSQKKKKSKYKEILYDKEQMINSNFSQEKQYEQTATNGNTLDDIQPLEKRKKKEDNREMVKICNILEKKQYEQTATDGGSPNNGISSKKKKKMKQNKKSC